MDEFKTSSHYILFRINKHEIYISNKMDLHYFKSYLDNASQISNQYEVQWMGCKKKSPFVDYLRPPLPLTASKSRYRSSHLIRSIGRRQRIVGANRSSASTYTSICIPRFNPVDQDQANRSAASTNTSVCISRFNSVDQDFVMANSFECSK